MTVRHVLLDADGVLQHVSGGWRETMVRHLGDRFDDFVPVLEELEAPALAGHGDFPAGLGPALADHGVTAPVEEVYADLWLSIDVHRESLALVRALRDAGLGVHVGTNQHARRAAYMKQTLGYDALFDDCFYSCDIGIAKPDAGFFGHVAERLGVPAAEVLFVDDSATNVRGARAADMRAEQWTIADGPERIRSLMAAHGVTLSA